ncbi:MAG: 4Fe-4S dicluster domain-containing protein [Nitrospinota bacterium]|nr:4Fe-4S dicluster domain-containing protein [Nitrospinota bacterium]
MNLTEAVKAAGIIGAGGAGFPTHVKLQRPVEDIIVNGAECEPLIFSDQVVMETMARQVLAGLRLVIADFTARGQSPKATICVKKKYKASLAALRAEIREGDPIRILELENVYPSGDEQFLVYEATGRVVPEGGIPPMVNALVMNVGTLAQVAAAADGAPVTERMVTIGGDVENPCVASVPVGTPFSAILQAAKPAIEDYVLLVNGPMMGRLADDMNDVTTKTMSGLFALPRRHSHVSRMRRPLSTEIKISKASCEVCRYCTDFCPRYLLGHGLEPHKIMRVINYDRDLDTKTITSAWLCCECGVCDLWACPMALSPRIIFRQFKRRLAQAGIKNPHDRANTAPDHYRKYRGVPTNRLTQRLGLTAYDKRPGRLAEKIEPQLVRIRLDQHIGAPARPVVAVGEKVEAGQLIGDIPEGKMGARYHASIGGKVARVTDKFITIER